jgi:ABC-2 type transport system permease protein
MSMSPRKARELVSSEWTKLWSTRTTWAIVAMAAALAIGVAALAAQSDAHDIAGMTAVERARIDPISDSFIGFLLAQLLFASLGALAITGEYGSGLIRTTFAAVPVRWTVLAAKAAVVAGLAAVTGALTALASFATAQAILSGHHLGVSIGDPDARRAIVGTTVYLTAVSLIGLGLGTLLRHTAPTIGTLVALLFLAPELLHGGSSWIRDVGNTLPGNAIRRLASQDAWPGAPSVAYAFTAIAVYPIVVMAVAAVALRRRDA